MSRIECQDPSLVGPSRGWDAARSGDTLCRQFSYRLPRKPERIHVDWRPLANERSAEYPDLPPAAVTRPWRRTGSRCSSRPAFAAAPRCSGTFSVTRRGSPPTTSRCIRPCSCHRAACRGASTPRITSWTNYWAEYERIPDLESWYTEPWHCQDLYLDALHWKPALAAYLQVLIRSAEGRPVLQFNRVDFRLDWLRHVFPDGAAHPSLPSSARPMACRPCGAGGQFRPARSAAAVCGPRLLLPAAVGSRDLSSHFPVLDWSSCSIPIGCSIWCGSSPISGARPTAICRWRTSSCWQSPRQTIGGDV